MGQTTTVETPPINIKFIIDDNGKVHASDPVIDEFMNFDKMAEEAIISAFKADKLCPSEVGQVLGITTRKAREWLHARGVASYRSLPADMEEEQLENLNKARKILTIKK